MLFLFAERLLRLDREVRRKEYRRQDFMPLEKIPTWREENISKTDSFMLDYSKCPSEFAGTMN